MIKQLESQQSGQVLVWTAMMLVLLLVLVGLVFDGGLMWAQYRRARWAADGAAVAAASEIDAYLFLEEGRIVLTDGALYTAERYARANNPHLHLTGVYAQNNIIHVEGYIEARSVFLSLVGAGDMRLQVSGRERPAWGISEQGQ